MKVQRGSEVYIYVKDYLNTVTYTMANDEGVLKNCQCY